MQIGSRNSSKLRRSLPLTATCSFLEFNNDFVSPYKPKFRHLFELSAIGFQKPGQGELFPVSERKQMNFNGLRFRSYASMAEAVEMAAASHTDMEEDNNVNQVAVPDEVEQLLTEVRKEERRQYYKRWRTDRNVRLGSDKYRALKRRQVKFETQAWEQAAKEYRELLNDMCEQKLAPNLPYMKSLFLGWFEPLRDKIEKEQEFIREGKSKAAYAKYFDQLPADMMAVITMHKLMGLLMTGGEHGSARVVQAACMIGEAIEQEVGYQRN